MNLNLFRLRVVWAARKKILKGRFERKETFGFLFYSKTINFKFKRAVRGG